MKKKSIAHLYDRLCQTVENIRKNFDPVCAFLLAVMPFLQHYEGIIDNAATSLLALLVPYLALRVICCIKTGFVSKIRLLAILSLFYVYKLFAHGMTFFELAQVVLVCGYLVAISLDCIELKSVIKSSIYIAAIASFLLVIQYFCYYVLKFHLQLVPVSLLLPESQQWVLGVQTGLAGINGKIGTLYRPSAFFLEPSHYFLYSFPLLFVCLLSVDREKEKFWFSIAISIGIVLSTSGMGIAVVFGAWSLFFLLRSQKDKTFQLKNMILRRNIIECLIWMVAAIAMLLCIPSIRESVLRIFFSTNGSSTAIAGRTEGAVELTRNLSSMQRIFGVSDTTAHIKRNMPGFMATYYKYGVIGVVLSYEFYVKGLFKLNLPYFWATAILLVVSFFSAHTHGTFFMLYYVMILVHGHRETNVPWINEILCVVKSVFKKKGDYKDG